MLLNGGPIAEDARFVPDAVSWPVCRQAWRRPRFFAVTEAMRFASIARGIGHTGIDAAQAFGCDRSGNATTMERVAERLRKRRAGEPSYWCRMVPDPSRRARGVEYGYRQVRTIRATSRSRRPCEAQSPVEPQNHDARDNLSSFSGSHQRFAGYLRRPA